MTKQIDYGDFTKHRPDEPGYYRAYDPTERKVYEIEWDGTHAIVIHQARFVELSSLLRFHGPLALPPSRMPVEKGEWDYEPKLGDLVEIRSGCGDEVFLHSFHAGMEVWDYKWIDLKERGYQCRLMRAVPAEGGE